MILSIETATDCKRLDQWLTSAVPELTRARIKMLVESGDITFADGSLIRKLSAEPQEGMSFIVNIPPPVLAVPQAENIPLDVLYEDASIIVINKQPGIVVHPACGHESGTLVNALIYHCPDLPGIGGERRPGIVHRLDKDTSGVMIVAKSEQAMAALGATFKDHVSITKIYTAIVHGRPRFVEGSIENLIGRHPANRQKQTVVKVNGKLAITHYHLEEVRGNVSRMTCQIDTGRTHQIRVHMAGLCCPVIGDTLYGKSVADQRLETIPTRQLLHARQLSLPHPVTGEIMTFTAPYPEDFAPYL